MKKLFLILIIGLLLISCKKERTIHITARNAVTGAPYPGLRYQVVREWSAASEEKSKIVGYGKLDENGEIYFTKRLQKEDTYRITVEEPENSCYNKDISLFMGGETTFEAPFEFAECAHLKLSIHNVNCQGAGDNIKLYHYGSSVGFLDALKDDPIKTGEGCFGYEGSSFSSVPMGERYYKWEVTRNNITNTYYDTLYLAPGEYKTYEIDY